MLRVLPQEVEQRLLVGGERLLPALLVEERLDRVRGADGTALGRRRTTIAGVSVATVSHALSGKGRVPDETHQRVREVADRLRYHPNASARSLAKGRTEVIAMAFSMPEAITKTLTDIDYFSQAIRAGTEPWSTTPTCYSARITRSNRRFSTAARSRTGRC